MKTKIEANGKIDANADASASALDKNLICILQFWKNHSLYVNKPVPKDINNLNWIPSALESVTSLIRTYQCVR